MKIKPFLSFVTLLCVVSLACSNLTLPPTATATPAPTQTQKPLPTSLPTNTPQPAATPITLYTDGVAKDALETTLFTHKSGAISFYPPKGWKVDSDDNEIFIDSPEGVSFYVAFVNTGYELDAKQLATFADNTEFWYYSYRDGYKELDRQSNPAIGLEAIKKTYPMNDGTTYFTHSVYQRIRQAVFIIEMTGINDLILSNPSYEQIFNAFFLSITGDAEAVATLPAYGLWAGYRDNGYQFYFPMGWSYEYEDMGTFGSQETFVSPDGNASIQVLSEIDAWVGAGDLASVEKFGLGSVKPLLAGKGIPNVIKREEKSNGVLDEWKAATEKSSGYMYAFEKSGSLKPFVWIFVWKDDFDDLYRQAASDIANSLKPEQ